MKKFLLSLLIAISTFSFSQNFQWVKDLSDSDPENFSVQDIEIGPSGHVYVLANFSGTIDLAPGANEYNITSLGGEDFFIAKYTASGQFYNAFVSGNDGQYNATSVSSDELAYDMTISSSGDIYVTGSFENDYYFAPYVQGSSIESDCSRNMFVAKFSDNLGYQWVSTPYECFEDMEISTIEGRKIFYHAPNDEVFVAGKFTGDISFTSSSSIYSSDSNQDLFFGKVDGNGTYSWAKALKSSTDQIENIGGILVHPDYNYIYLAGDFRGTLDMNPTASTLNITSNGGSDIFMGFFTSSGANFSSTYYGNIGTSSYETCSGMDMDSEGNIYLSSNLYQYRTMDLNMKSGTENISSGVGNDAFIVKYNYLLDYQWNIQMDGSQNNSLQGGIGIDSDDNICVQGWFYGNCDFNSNGTAYNLSAGSNIDLFFGKYNSAGEKLIIHKIGDELSNTTGDMKLGVSKHTSDMVIFGKYSTTQDFDGGIGETYSTPINHYNGRYFAKYSDCTPSTIISQPNSDYTCEGNEVSLGFNASGTSLSYQWYKDTSPIDDGYTIFGNVIGANTSTLIIDNVNINTDEIYKCEVSSSCDDIISTDYTNISVDLEPSISGHPSAITSCQGNDIDFTVTAQNATSYQWLVNNGSGNFQAISNNAEYSGTQTSTLTVIDINPNQSYYQFKCVVEGVCDPETHSNPATLIVNPTPNIQSNPSNTSVCEGSSTTFSVSTNGNGLNYQWEASANGTNFVSLSDNVNYSGTQSSILTISSVLSNMNNYQYKCVVSGSCGSDMSSTAAILTVNNLAILSTHPIDTEECEYEDITYSVNASGDDLNYRWQENNGSGWNNLNNGGSYSNVTNPSLNISYLDPSLSGNQYRCLITSTCSPNIYSNTANLTVSTTPDLSINSSEGSDFCDGETSVLSITGGNTDYTYQWKRNYSDLIGSNNDDLIIGQSGIYSVYAENLIGCSSESDPININVHALPNANITTIGNSEFCEGGYAELIVPSGNGYTYLWYNNTDIILGASSNSLITTESGNFNANVTSIYGCENNSSIVSITSNPLPAVTLSSSNIEICEGEMESIMVDNNSNYVYQWKQNNLNISGANSYSLEITENGLYNVQVMNSNTGCAYTSSYASAIVNQLPTPELQANSVLTYCVADQVSLSTSETYSTYFWQDGTNNSTLNITDPGTYYVTVSDNNGCEASDEILIVEQLVATPNICMVTVDTAVNKNLIVWENTPNITGIASYNVYKLVNSSYQLLGNILYNDTTQFLDLTSEPSIHSDKYVIASVDSCGNIGAYSPYHQTMNLSIVDGSGDALSLIWTKYIDEADINNPTEYEIYRGVGSLNYFASITGGLSDYNYNIPTTTGDESFIIIVQRPIGCSPLNNSRASGGPYYQSSSNIEDEGLIDTKVSQLDTDKFTIYPNPSTDYAIIKTSLTNGTIKLFNALGIMVFMDENVDLRSYKLELKQLPRGTYVTDVGHLKMKLILK